MRWHLWMMAALAALGGASCSSSGTVDVPASNPDDAGITDATGGQNNTNTSKDATVACSAGQTSCGGSCVTLQTSNDHCGACGNKCGSTEVCSNGQCTATCASNLTTCGGDGGAKYCANTQSDNRNCGGCGVTCGAGQFCSAGSCSVTCASDMTQCNGDAGGPYCANTRTDNGNCGACGVTCSAGKVCSNGTCATTCASNLSLCNADAGADAGAPYCSDTKTDEANCGACGVACGAGQACTNGVCVADCGIGFTRCGGPGGDAGADAGAGYCANLTSDPNNCNACGRRCASGEVCSNGTCTASCSSPLTTCTRDAGPNYCANLQSDPSNCNSCGRACANGEVCTNGTCSLLCGNGQVKCPGGGTPYCSTVTTDFQNCGGCGNVCPSGLACVNGSCSPQGPLNVTTNTNLSTTNTNGRTCGDGGDMVSYSVTGLTSTTATLSAAPAAGCLAPGDELLLINLQGTGTGNANVGNHETLRVLSVTGSTVTFTAAKTKFYGDGANNDTNLGTARTNQRVVLQRVPVYSTVTVAASQTLSANAWNGTRGGVFAIRATGAVTINGTVSMKGAGFAGGARTTTVDTTGNNGESISGLGARLRTANVTGGGGGGVGDNQGCRPLGVAGAGGGHGTAGGNAQDTSCGGIGGPVYGDALLTKMFFGSGGGGGGTDNTLSDNPPGGAGGAGGGIILIGAPTGITVNGAIDASGLNGEGDAPGANCTGVSTTTCWDFSGPGGGGAGGTINLTTNNLVGGENVIATGGIGGDGNGSGPDGAGDAGNGGAGRIRPALPADCSEILAANPLAPNGTYAINPGTGAFRAYCDMTTDGGGWTIVYASSGADNEQPLTGNVEVAGNPLTFNSMNLNRARKMAIAARSNQSLFRRPTGAWLKATAAMFDSNLATPNSESAVPVVLFANDGTMADGFMGYSNYNITGGGDFGISFRPDGSTCGGPTTNGFDRHQTNYWHLNCSCQRQYFYNYSSGALDGDSSYQAGVALGSWTTTAACSSQEGNGMVFYAAMRNRAASVDVLLHCDGNSQVLNTFTGTGCFGPIAPGGASYLRLGSGTTSAIVYSGPNCTGCSYTVTSDLDFCGASFSGCGGLNDNVQSVFLP